MPAKAGANQLIKFERPSVLQREEELALERSELSIVAYEGTKIMNNTINSLAVESNPEPIEPAGDDADELDLDLEMLEFEASQPQSVAADSQATVVANPELRPRSNILDSEMIRVLEEVFSEMGGTEFGEAVSLPGLTDMSPLWMKDENGNSILEIDKRRAPKTSGITRMSDLSQAQQISFLEKQLNSQDEEIQLLMEKLKFQDKLYN